MKYKHIIFLSIVAIALHGCIDKSNSKSKEAISKKELAQKQAQKDSVKMDSLAFWKKINSLANNDDKGYWPIKDQPFPPKGAILPFHRIVAYYGNLYSKRMGALGEYPPDEMWKRLNEEVSAWQKADSTTPVIPAIHYIAVVAQGSPQKDGKYRLRMPKKQIDSALAIAKMGNAIVFLDIQLGQSSVQEEIPRLEEYLKMPQVHLGIDPEFAMHDGKVPGRKIGSIDAEDINYCTQYLSDLVKKNNLTPKILIVHRFTKGMVKNYKNITLKPEVQIVMNMDGWGGPELKYSTYKTFIYREPVQFTGFKLFYKNDLKKSPNRMLTPPELLILKPQPIYIQYQ